MITDDDPTIEYPEGWSMAILLPRKLRYALIADIIHDSAGNGKSYLETIFDKAEELDWIAVGHACQEAYVAVSHHPVAERWYRENIWLEES